MSKLSTNGFDEAAKEIQDLSDAIKDLDGKELSAEDLFDKTGFISLYTHYSTLASIMF